MKVLIAEDSKVSRESMHNMLSLMFDDVYVASDGKEALEIFCNNRDIDLLITDLHMPHIDGDILISKLKRQKADLLVVLLSAFEDEAKQRLEGRLKHCNQCIVIAKPLKCNELIEGLVNMDNRFDRLKRYI